MNSYIFTDDDSLSLSIANKAYNVDASHNNWDAILTALRASQFDSIPGLINIAKAIQQYVGLSNIEVNVDYGTITYAGTPLHGVIVDRIMQMCEDGFNIAPMLAFLDNLMDNPSKRAVDELYGFLQYGKLPITEDGHFIAYKRVRNDYKSVYDGKTDNSIGTKLSMPRNLVNENSEQTCSDGLHFCSHEYLKSFSGERIIVLKVNPRDVVSIPADYNNTKGRACGYEVIGELSKEEFDAALNENIFTASVHGVKPAEAQEVQIASDAFIEGYLVGYSDNAVSAEDDNSNSHAYLSKNENDYCAGYSRGWTDSSDQNTMLYTYDDLEPESAPIQAEATVTSYSNSPFAHGYHTAYTDAIAHNGYDNGNDYAWNGKEERQYDDGYKLGWGDAHSYTPPQHAYMASAYTVTDTDFSVGYTVGYRVGRNKQKKVALTGNAVYDQGAALGYKDGKGHKSKQY